MNDTVRLDDIMLLEEHFNEVESWNVNDINEGNYGEYLNKLITINRNLKRIFPDFTVSKYKPFFENSDKYDEVKKHGTFLLFNAASFMSRITEIQHQIKNDIAQSISSIEISDEDFMTRIHELRARDFFGVKDYYDFLIKVRVKHETAKLTIQMKKATYWMVGATIVLAIGTILDIVFTHMNININDRLLTTFLDLVEIVIK